MSSEMGGWEVPHLSAVLNGARWLMALEEGVLRTEGEGRKDKAQGPQPLREHWPTCDWVRSQCEEKVRPESGIPLGTQPQVNVKGPSVTRF